MNSRDRVLTAFAHEEPDRVPRWCGSSPEFWSKAKSTLQLDDEGLRRRFGDDFRRVFARYAGPDFPLSPGIACRARCSASSAAVWDLASRPAIRLRRHRSTRSTPMPWPDPQWLDVSHVREEALSWHREYAVLGGDWSPFWHDAIDLLGMENLYFKMFDEPDIVDAVLQHIVDFYAAVSQQIFDAAADALDIFFIGNDFGSQTGPLLSPVQFDRFMLPHVARLIDLGHAYGLKVQLHCCGGFEPLIPAMIAAGLDGLHAIQPCCGGMDLATLKAQVRPGDPLQRCDRLAPRGDQGHARICPPGHARRAVDHGARRRLCGRRQPRLHPRGDARGKRRGHV